MSEAYGRRVIAHHGVPFNYLYNPDGDRLIDCEGSWAYAVWKRWREMGLPEAAVRAVLGDAADADSSALPADAAIDGPGRTTAREDALVGLAVAHGWAAGHCEDGFNSLACLHPRSKRMERAAEYLVGRFGAKAAPSISEWELDDNFRLAMAMRLLVADAARQDRGDGELLSPECLEAIAALAWEGCLTLEPLLRRAVTRDPGGGKGAGLG